MSRFSFVLGWGLPCLLVALGNPACAAERPDPDYRAELDALRREVRELKTERASYKSVGSGTAEKVDKLVECKYGPNAVVTTKQGKLAIGGLLQVWFYTIQNDNQGVFGGDLTAGPGGGDTNETKDNDSFRIRRSELKFTMDIHENITGVVMIDPAREAQSYPAFSTNLGTATRGRTNETSGAVTNVQTGAGGANRMLQDAYINFHGVVPHHDFQIGQYKPPFGDEGIRSSAELDFVERSLIGQLGDKRDQGFHVHGTWWDDRFQYWTGLYNGAGNLHGSAGDSQNRSDDNDAKDWVGRLLARPVWKNETWGSLELGWSSQFGKRGEAGNPRADGADADSNPDASVDGLNRRETWASRHGAWTSYRPGGPVRGWWLRGEWQWNKDRNIPTAVRGFPQSDGTLVQDAPNPFITTGWFFSTGYKLSDSIWDCKVPSWLKPFEFAFRYETFDNLTVGDLANPESETDVFNSSIYSLGINYYLKGHNAKIQLMYNWVNEPDEDSHNGARPLREVRNDNLVVSFQVAF